MKDNKIKKLLVIICFAFSGLLAGNLIAPSSTVALHPCEDDECEEGLLSDYCVDNPGGGTYCNFVGDDCQTKACGHDIGENDG